MRGPLNADSMIVPARGTNYPSVSMVYLTSAKVTSVRVECEIGAGKCVPSRCSDGQEFGQPQAVSVPG